MPSAKSVHGLIGFVAVLISSAMSLALKQQAAFRVQSYASPADPTNETPINPENRVDFTPCTDDQSPIYGNVTSVIITPCERSDPTAPCTFVFRSNYTIELDFETAIDSPDPRSSVVAYDQDGAYQYSGQSFNGCKYATCPIRKYTPSAYVYHFRTLASPFTSLTFNVTSNITGPSLFCASTNINFVSSE